MLKEGFWSLVSRFGGFWSGNDGLGLGFWVLGLGFRGSFRIS